MEAMQRRFVAYFQARDNCILSAIASIVPKGLHLRLPTRKHTHTRIRTPRSNIKYTTYSTAMTIFPLYMLSCSHTLSLSVYLAAAEVLSMFRMLLVIAALCCAQAHSAVTSQRPRLLQALGDATKALQAAQQSLEEALRKPPSPALTSVSVVQDWSLVCKELCG